MASASTLAATMGFSSVVSLFALFRITIDKVTTNSKTDKLIFFFIISFVL